MIDEDLAHGAGGGMDEMFAALPTAGIAVHQFQPGFMDQSGRLKGMRVAGKQVGWLNRSQDFLILSTGAGLLTRSLRMQWNAVIIDETTAIFC